MAKRRYVARGVPGGYRIWDNRSQRWWGDLYEMMPDALLRELNGPRRPDQLVELTRVARATRR